jgi:lipopolysaccharide export LptBFGC system permease protein LptF
MKWAAYLRRLAVELVFFLLLTAFVFYLASGRDSMVGAINMAIIATVFYGGVTFVLRQRALRQEDED